MILPGMIMPAYSKIVIVVHCCVCRPQLRYLVVRLNPKKRRWLIITVVALQI
jgi:hypothetical protein